MRSRFIRIVVGLCIGVLFPMASLTSSWAADYYVRPDGGTAGQCTGLADAPYPGSGTNQPCAWAHPFWALDGNEPPSWKIQGGDTLIIHPGSYRMGFGAPNTTWCSSDYPWDCHLPPLPSGPDEAHPTRILGAGWDQGCPTPPELWGTERAWQIINLSNTSNAEIRCLELTDHSGCVEYHTNAAVSCEHDTYPFGDWAVTGIYAEDSSHVLLRDLNVHGIANQGIHAGRISDWTVENVRIAGNGWAGWNGDLDETDSNSGSLVFRNWTVEWNGCAESYPDEQFTDCWAQPAEGYGDGLGTGATGGHWIIEDSVFRYNTSDGLDLLYVREAGGQIEIRRTKAYGNAGDQIKVTGPTQIENVLVISNCGFFDNQPFAPDILIQGVPTDPVDHCRAGGSALAINLRQGSAVSVLNSTIVGQGDCLAIVECDPNGGNCDGSETLIVQNNLFQGYEDFIQPGDDTCYFWFDQEIYTIQMDYNVIYDVKFGNGGCPFGTKDLCEDPLFVNSALDSFDGHLQATSPAVDSGLAVGSLGGLVPNHDLQNTSRPQGGGVDRGAYEYLVAAQAPDISVSPPSVEFGNVSVGSTAQAQTVSITNGGNADLVIGNLSITGTDGSQFPIQKDTCSSKTITPSAGCTADVAFSPTSPGLKSANLSIPSNDPDENPMNVVLNGSGLSTLATISGKVSVSIAGHEDLSVINATVTLQGTSHSTATDSGGNFMLEDVPPGTYTLTVTAPDLVPISQEATVAEGDVLQVDLPKMKVFRKGDATGDGMTGLDDVIYILQVLLGLRENGASP